MWDFFIFKIFGIFLYIIPDPASSKKHNYLFKVLSLKRPWNEMEARRWIENKRGNKKQKNYILQVLLGFSIENTDRTAF